jgi:hypothetical protein
MAPVAAAVVAACLLGAARFFAAACLLGAADFLAACLLGAPLFFATAFFVDAVDFFAGARLAAFGEAFVGVGAADFLAGDTAVLRPVGDVLVVFFVVAMRREPPRRRDRTGQYSWRTPKVPPVSEEQASPGTQARPTVVIRPVAVSDDSGATPARRWPALPRPAHAIVATLTFALVVGGGAFVYSTRSSLDVEGIANGQRITRRDLPALSLRVTGAGAGAGDVRVVINGETVPLSTDGDADLVGPEVLRDVIVEGSNELVVSQPGRLGLGGATVERVFTFDPAGPVLMVPAAVPASTAARPTVLRGLVDYATTLTANGGPLTIEPGGAFTMPVAVDVSAIALVATDAAGITAEATVAVTPDPPPAQHPQTVAVHVTAQSWADVAVREPILAMARLGLINAVQLDIKDEGGVVGYSSTVPMAVTTGAAVAHYDAEAALEELHDLGVRVIGRIVCFLDPKLASWAWENGREDLLVLQGSGGPLQTDYGTAAFTNVANPEVRQYQIDLAVEAARLGFDGILYDYVRRPEGNTASMYFPDLQVAPDVAVARFVADTNVQLAAETDAMLGVSVFGISATRPEQIAQDIRLMAPHVDYVAPMIYPSHWSPGEYGVADPNRQPADIVGASVGDFTHVVSGSGAAVVPWLQDFSAGGVAYGPVEVRAQIDAALANGAAGFLLWNSGSIYTEEALQPPVFAPTD